MSALTTIGDRGRHLIVRGSPRQAERYLDYQRTVMTRPQRVHSKSTTSLKCASYRSI